MLVPPCLVVSMHSSVASAVTQHNVRPFCQPRHLWASCCMQARKKPTLMTQLVDAEQDGHDGEASLLPDRKRGRPLMTWIQLMFLALLMVAISASAAFVLSQNTKSAPNSSSTPQPCQSPSPSPSAHLKPSPHPPFSTLA